MKKFKQTTLPTRWQKPQTYQDALPKVIRTLIFEFVRHPPFQQSILGMWATHQWKRGAMVQHILWCPDEDMWFCACDWQIEFQSTGWIYQAMYFRVVDCTQTHVWLAREYILPEAEEDIPEAEEDIELYYGKPEKFKLEGPNPYTEPEDPRAIHENKYITLRKEGPNPDTEPEERLVIETH